MIRITELALPLDYPPDALREAVSKRLQVSDDDLLEVQLFKRSYDARKKNAIKFVCIVDVSVRDEAAVLKRFARDPQVKPAPDTSYHPVAIAPAELKDRPIVIGFGPGGLFAALLLAQMGFRPIVLERGRDVRRRTQDAWGLWRRKILDPKSNVQFGEGGAGLFSDGKLYSQIKDPKFYGRKVMHEFVRAGAPEDILFLGRPHIGTFRLTGVVARMREEIIALGEDSPMGEGFMIYGEHCWGGHCAYAVAPGRNVVKRPSGRTWEECAAYPLAYLTAFRMLRRGRLQAGQTLLVVGVGSGVSCAGMASAAPSASRATCPTSPTR